MTAKVLVTDPMAPGGLELLRRHTSVTVKTGLTPGQLAAIIGDYDALIVRSETQVTAEVIGAGTRLQVIGRAGVGVDNIDLEAATRRGIVVVNAPEANIISAAEHTLALMLSLARHIPRAHYHVKEGRWQRNQFIGVEMRHKTLGLVGLGRVGTEVARRARGLEMRIIAYDPFVSPEHARNIGVELVSLEDLLKSSDFISLHTPLNEQTRHLLGEQQFHHMKPGTRLVNAARGDLIDEAALLHALDNGRLAGVALDVFTHEPPEPSPLLTHEKVVLSPHLAGSTAEAQAEVSVDIAEEVLAVLQGQPARYAVNAPLLSPEVMRALKPHIPTATAVARLASRLGDGQPTSLLIKYEGDLANLDTTPLKAIILGVFLESVTSSRVNIVNVNLLASQRGLKILEQKELECEAYSCRLVVEAASPSGVTRIAGTCLRNETHIVQVNDFYLDFVPTPGYWVFCDHTDHPGLVGAIGTILGNADINISTMHLARLKSRGPALMVLSLDEPLGEEPRQQILAIPGIKSVQVVKL